MLFFFIPTGIFLNNKLNLKSNNLPIIVFLGMLLQTILLTMVCFFSNIGITVFVINFILVSLLGFIYFENIKKLFTDTSSDFKKLSNYSKILLLITLIFTTYKCASAPFFIDNESYYIQTIKWINEYGFVKGLANLHVFFAQTSAIHVLQAGFNFSFISQNFNDINGLILLISAFYFTEKFEKQFQINKKSHWIGFIPCFNVLFFQFVSQPSPDFILIVVSQIIFYLFLEENESQEALKTAIFLFLFLVFVKITIAPIGLLILFWMYQQKKFLILFSVSSCFLLMLFVIKNIIISGYPLYPFEYIFYDFEWKIPDNLFSFITNATKNAGYFENEVVANPSFYDKLYAWINLKGLNIFFNLGIIFLFVISYIINQLSKTKKFKIVFFTLLIHFLILLFTSPQYRFFLPEFVFLAVFLIAVITNFLKFDFKTIQIGLILFVIVTFFGLEYIDFKKLTDNKYLQKKSDFQFSNILIPRSNTKYEDLEFIKIKNENLEYYSPKQNFFFFGTANGDLPCVNKVQIDYFEKYYFIKPQFRTTEIKDGFYSKILNNPK